MPRPLPLRTVHCGPCWAEFGGSPDAAAIGPPLPEAIGSRDPRDQREWLARLAAEDWVQLRRDDCRGRLLLMAAELALTANWDTWHTWPGWDRLMKVSRWSRSSVASWLRQLRLLGWLTVVESGSTPQFRPMALADVEGNRRAVYALRVPLHPGDQPAEPAAASAASEPVLGAHVEVTAPPARARQSTHSDQHGYRTGDHNRAGAVDETWTPTWFFDLSCYVGNWVSSRASDFVHNPQVSPPVGTTEEALRARFDERWFAFSARVPAAEAQMLAAGAELRRQHAVLALLTSRAVRALCRPYWDAGWTNDDVLHALTWRPASRSTLPTMDAAKVVAPFRWAQSRLSAWRTDTGKVLPGHSQPDRNRRVHERAVLTRHGRAGLAALPAGAARLRPADVRRYGRRRASVLAGAALDRRQDVASAAHRAQTSAEFRAERERRAQRDELGEQLLAQARAAEAERQTQTEPETRWTPPRPAQTPQERYELALARARAEGRLPLPRRHRRPRC